MPGTIISTLHHGYISFLQLNEVGTMEIPVLETRKLRLKNFQRARCC